MSSTYGFSPATAAKALRVRLTRSAVAHVALLLVWLVILSPPVAVAAQPGDGQAAIAQGVALRQQGELQRSIDVLGAVVESREAAGARAQAAGELGISLLQARRYELAAIALQQAYASLHGVDRARQAVYLGNLSVLRKDPMAARRYYAEALELAAGDTETELGAAVNLARIAPEEARLSQLRSLSQKLAAWGARGGAARYHLNIGAQARGLKQPALQLAFEQLDLARQQAQAQGNTRLLIEAEDELSQLYEDQGRLRDALALSRRALGRARAPDAGLVADLQIQLEWRQARLLRLQGQPDPALAAYGRAVAHIQSIRQDIPIDYENGRSSFSQTLEPVYLGYADMLLQLADRQQPEAQAEYFRKALDAVEEIKQAELQDFLGDRCAVEVIQGGASDRMPPGAAAFYPVLFADRTELLLKTHGGIVRKTAAIDGATVRAAAIRLAGALRNGTNDFQASSRQLYDWLLKPLEDILAEQRIDSLIVVPDGTLRLLPIGALHDGREFAIEKYAVSTVTGLSITNTAKARSRNVEALVVGVSEPGPVIEKLSQRMTAQLLEVPPPGQQVVAGLAETRSMRSIGFTRAPDARLSERDDPARRLEELRARLSLPGVKTEVDALSATLRGMSLLNGAFTIAHFGEEAESGHYRILHIASHGVFGGNAESSFIMAYDDLLTMNGLQAILKAEMFTKTPIELLSLSACETAEGNERAPLGISGAAIKARAKSVMGTLWPVDDEAAQSLMQDFYKGLTAGRMSKTQALRRAQINLLVKPESAHPMFWAPFVIIGNWL